MDPKNSSETTLTNADKTNASIPMRLLENFFMNFTEHQIQLFEKNKRVSSYF